MTKQPSKYTELEGRELLEIYIVEPPGKNALPKPSAEIYVPELDHTHTQKEREAHVAQRALAISAALQTGYDSNELETLENPDDLKEGDVLFYSKGKRSKHAVVENRDGKNITVRFIGENGRENIITDSVDTLYGDKEMIVFVIKKGATRFHMTEELEAGKGKTLGQWEIPNITPTRLELPGDGIIENNS